MGYINRILQEERDVTELERIYANARSEAYQGDYTTSAEALNSLGEDFVNYGTFFISPDQNQSEGQAMYNDYLQDISKAGLAMEDALKAGVLGSGYDSYTKERLRNQGYEYTSMIDDKSVMGEFVLPGVENSMGYWDANWWATWADKHGGSGIAGEELPTLYTVARQYSTGADTTYKEWAEKTPGAQISEYDREAAEYYQKDSNNWERFLPWDGAAWRHPVLANLIVVANPSDDKYNWTFPGNFFSSRRQEGWDGKKAYEVFEKTNPHLLKLAHAIGVSRETLEASPNHWEFRYAINNAVQMYTVSGVLDRTSARGSGFGNASRFVGSFAWNTLNSADMPVEIATAILTGGTSLTYTAVKGSATLAKIGYKTSKRVSRLERMFNTTRKVIGIGGRSRYGRVARRAEVDKADVDVLTNWSLKTRKLRNLMANIHSWIPSNIPDKIIMGGYRKAFGTEMGLGKGFKNYSQFWLTRRGLDFGIGTIEGAMYGALNQYDGNDGWDWSRFWNEVITEGVGQVFAGPTFRMVLGRGVMAPAHKIGKSTLNKIYEKMDFSPEVRAAIDAAYKPIMPNFDRMTVEQQESILSSRIMLGLAHSGYGKITGTDGPIPMYLQNMVDEISAATGIPIDAHSAIDSIYTKATDSEGNTTELTELEMSLALIHAVMNQVDNQGRQVLQVKDPETGENVGQIQSLLRTAILHGLVHERATKGGTVELEGADLVAAQVQALEELAGVDQVELQSIVDSALKATKTVMEKLGIDASAIVTTAGRSVSSVQRLDAPTIEILRRLYKENKNIDLGDGIAPEDIAAIREDTSDPDTPTDVDEATGTGETTGTEAIDSAASTPPPPVDNTQTESANAGEGQETTPSEPAAVEGEDGSSLPDQKRVEAAVEQNANIDTLQKLGLTKEQLADALETYNENNSCFRGVK